MWLTQAQLLPWAMLAVLYLRGERRWGLLGSGSSLALAFLLGLIDSRFLSEEL